MKRIINIIFMALIFSGCQTGGNSIQNEQTLTTDVLRFPFLESTRRGEYRLTSIVDGVVEDVSTDELGMLKIVVKTEIEYYFEDERRTVQYYLIYGGMKNAAVSNRMSIKVGDFLGDASRESYLTSYHETMESFMLRMTSSHPVQYGTVWYFSPNWLIQGNTAWMTFRPVENFEEAVADFYHRWEIEREEAVGATIHYFDDLDRIRAIIRLDHYPVSADRDSAVRLVEDIYYGGMKVYVLETRMTGMEIDGHDVVIYWQPGFDDFLEDEYRLNRDLYIYASIYAIDHDDKEILVCVRDFALYSDEEVLQNRLTEIEKRK